MEINPHRKTIVYIAASLDGYIAKPDDDLSFLNKVHLEGEDYGYQAFLETIDTVVLGRKTYDWVMTQVPEFPHADTETYVITRTARPTSGKVTFYTGSPEVLIQQLKNKPGKNIFIDGGAELVNSLLKSRLIDEIIVSVIPVLLGAGVKLFQEGIPEQDLTLISQQAFSSGLVQVHYRIG